jgi:hypothetical protein
MPRGNRATSECWPDGTAIKEVLGAFSPATNFAASISKTYQLHADELLQLYPAGDGGQVKRSAQALPGDQFMAYSTWEWLRDAQGYGRIADFSV